MTGSSMRVERAERGASVDNDRSAWAVPQAVEDQREGISGPNTTGLFRKRGAQGKSRWAGPESWTLWCADIRGCMLRWVLRAVARAGRCAGLGRVARLATGRATGAQQTAANWQCARRRGQRQRSAGRAGGCGCGVLSLVKSVMLPQSRWVLAHARSFAVAELKLLAADLIRILGETAPALS